ncbi:MAG TPA: hypothetical protein VNI20_01135 [Fimbriimonadaceae bacterium]|nr:hypothetical protein [Fimbriimonadaceae bacterium]
MKTKTLIVTLLTLAVFSLVFAGGVELRFQANLSGVGKGKAQYRERQQNVGVQYELSVEGENLAHNATYTVMIGSDISFSVTTDAFGKFNFDDREFAASGLGITSGTTVAVVDANGNTALAGTFQQN